MVCISVEAPVLCNETVSNNVFISSAVKERVLVLGGKQSETHAGNGQGRARNIPELRRTRTLILRVKQRPKSLARKTQRSRDTGLRKRVTCPFGLLSVLSFACGFFVGYRSRGLTRFNHTNSSISGFDSHASRCGRPFRKNRNPWWKTFCVNRVAPAILWILDHITSQATLVAGVPPSFSQTVSANGDQLFTGILGLFNVALGFFNEW